MTDQFLVIRYDACERAVAAQAYGPFGSVDQAVTWGRKRFGKVKEDPWQDFIDEDGEPVFAVVPFSVPENLDHRPDPGSLPADAWDDDPQHRLLREPRVQEPEVEVLEEPDDCFLPLVHRAQQILNGREERPDGRQERSE